MDYVLGLLIIVCIYAILTAALDLLVGYTLLLSFAPAAFVGFGAYASALSATKLGFGFVPALLFAIVFTAAAAALLAIPLLRMRGEYFLLATFGLSMVAGSVFDNWIDLTNGPFGVRGIPRPDILGFTFNSTVKMFALCVIVLAICLFIKWRLVRAPFGIALRAVREDETVAQTIGKDIWRIRLVVFAISAAFTAVGGTLLAYYLRIIDPTLFYFHTTIMMWAALFIGGCGSIPGNILGPAILVLFPEMLRFVGLTGSHTAHVQQGLYGALLVLLAIFRPQGIAGSYRFR